MNPLQGSTASYKHRDILYQIFYDTESHGWCVDTRTIPNGKIVCRVPRASEAVLLGKQIIENIWRASRMAPALPARRTVPRLPPAPAPLPSPPILLPAVPKRLKMPERWYEKHRVARQHVMRRYKEAVATLVARGPFRTEDLMRIVGRSEAPVRSVINVLVKQGYLTHTIVEDPVIERLRQVIVEFPQFTLRMIMDHVGTTRAVAKHLLKRMRQQGLIFVRVPRRARVGSGGALPAIYELTPEGVRWVQNKVRKQLSTRSSYPYVYYTLTAEGRRWIDTESPF